MHPLKSLLFLALLGCLLLLVPVVSGADGGGSGESVPFLLVEDPWPPYTLGENGGAATEGVAVELMREVFRRIDQPLALELHPWKRCIFMVQTGNADGLMLTVKTSEREEYAHFPEPFFINKIQFIHRKETDFQWQNFSDLKGLRIGLVAGAKYSQEFQDAILEFVLDVEIVNSIEINLKKLSARRIDITPVLEVVAATIIAGDTEFAGRFHAAKKPLRTTPMQMAISRLSPLMAFCSEIDQAIKDMKADGTVQKIYRKHVSTVIVH